MKGCSKCGNPVYVKPDGSDAVLCADCIMLALEDLGIFPKDTAVQHGVEPDVLPCGHPKEYIKYGFRSVTCGLCGESAIRRSR